MYIFTYAYIMILELHPEKFQSFLNNTRSINILIDRISISFQLPV